jgi:hypothetical protein
MTDAEMRLLTALAGMAYQYLGQEDGLDNLCMGAGEEALRVLASYGLVTISHGGRCGQWTQAGLELLDST